MKQEHTRRTCVLAVLFNFNSQESYHLNKKLCLPLRFVKVLVRGLVEILKISLFSKLNLSNIL